MGRVKSVLAAMPACNLRELVNRVNDHNSNPDNEKILKEDIVGIERENDTLVMLYFK